jgi:hypothetical protein
VTREALKARDGEGDEFLSRTTPQVAHGRVNPTASAGDLHVVESSRAQFLFVSARPAKNGVRMRVDESRHQHAAFAIDGPERCITRLEVVTRTDVEDPPAADSDCRIGQDSRISHFHATSRAARTSARDHLRRIQKKAR